MDGVSIIVDDEQIVAALTRLAGASSDLSEAMADISSAVLTSTQLRIEAEAGPDGAKWAPHAPSTLKRMPASRRANPKLLRDRGLLYASLTADSDAERAQVGSNLKYARIHQLGGTIDMPERQGEATFVYAKQGAGRTKDGRRVGSKLRFAKARTRAKSKHSRAFTVGQHQVPIPARPYLGISDADRTEILAIIELHFQRAVGGGAQ